MPTNKTFEWDAKLRINLPGRVFRRPIELAVSGEMDVSLVETRESETAELRIVRESIKVQPLSFLADLGPDLLRRLAEGPQITIVRRGPSAGDIGYVNLNTGSFVHSARLTLSRNEVPALNILGVDEIDVVVHQAGHMNLSAAQKSGALAAYLQFTVEPRLLTGTALQISGFGSKCATTTTICATTDGTQCTTKHTVYICPGESVYLWWQSSSDVKVASIRPDVGDVAPTGSIQVKPTQSTTYQITARGQCEVSDTVDVKVVDSPIPIDVAIPYHIKLEKFYLAIPKQFVSSMLFVRSVTPECGWDCFMHDPPILGYQYLRCSDGTLCNGYWTVEKIDYDGHVHDFSLGPMTIPVDFPYGGEWTLVPLHIVGPLKGNAYLKVTVACGK
jgi:hypothetical protein